MGTIEIRRAHQRFHTKLDWLESWHCFSFADHYDPRNTHHGLLRVLNEDVIAPGGGFPTHPHRDMEIVTWVLEGALAHHDSAGNEGVITPGVAQRMSAGTGIRHSEMNASRTEPVHLLQMWAPPDTAGLPPEYEQRDVSTKLRPDALFPLASGRDVGAAITIHQRDAALWVGQLKPAAQVKVPDAPWVDLFVARGSIELAGRDRLVAGDEARLTDAGPLDVTPELDGAEIIVWEMHSTID